jgi:hypothetical protein
MKYYIIIKAENFEQAYRAANDQGFSISDLTKHETYREVACVVDVPRYKIPKLHKWFNSTTIPCPIGGLLYFSTWNKVG